MTHGITKGLYEGLITLIQYLADNDIKSQYLNYGLKRNLKLLDREVKLIQESTSERLIELEKKVYAFKDEILLSDKETPASLLYSLGFNKLSEEEKTEHQGLVEEYNKFLLKETEISLYLLDPEDLKELPLPWAISNILDNFLKEK